MPPARYELSQPVTDLFVREDLVLAARAQQQLLLALTCRSVLLVGFTVLSISAVPIEDSVISADPEHSIRVLDGALHIPVA